MSKKVISFFKEDIWTKPDNHQSTFQQLGIKFLKVLLLSIQGFNKDVCQLRASALTLYSLLSIVPVIALLFGIAKGFGFEKKLEQQLLEQASDQDTMMLQLIEFSQNMLSSTKGGLVAGVGIIVLFWTVIKVIGNIEESFNYIWNIKKNRPLARKLSDYLSLMMLAPVLLIVSSSITVFIKTKITWLVEVIHLPEFGTKLMVYMMGFSPLIIMSLLFIFVFLFIPNQKISAKAGVVAGIVTGILFQMTQSAYLSLQIGVSSYNAIYGSFAALPLFLIWLQLVWMIVLFGCEISFFIHNFESYRHNKKFSNLSFFLKKNIAIQVSQLIVHRFIKEASPPNAELIANELILPLSIVQNTLSDLVEAHLIVELSVEEGEVDIYQPAMDVNNMTIGVVTRALESTGQNFVPGMKDDEQFLRINNLEDNYLVKEL
ncbi:MAG: YihY/virulence factor BrkB family protein [Methylococcales bacterium]|nr:YihY/virulence factor BrkB family protein [Methylococcales bacterium]